MEGGPTVSMKCWQVCISCLFPFLAVKQVLEEYRDQFIEYVDPDVVVYELHHKGIISQGVQAKIAMTYCCREKNQILHQCLLKTCTREALIDACRIIIAEAEKGNPNMMDLGKTMKKMLEPRKNLEFRVPVSACMRVCACACVL